MTFNRARSDSDIVFAVLFILVLMIPFVMAYLVMRYR